MTDKIDLKDVTFTIPVKIDHPDRERNLKVVVDYILHNFNTTVIICEQDTNKVPNILDGYEFKYLSTSRPDNMIHRTFQLNHMAKHSTTPFIANYDADVLAPTDQFIECMELLRNGNATVSLPYFGPCYDISVSLHDKILETHSLECVGDVTKTGHLMNKNSVGGALFWNKEDFIKGGMENEKFISWGFEDNERFHRFDVLGYKMARAKGCLYHLNHYRTPNSNHTHKFYNNNNNEYKRIRNMNKQQLEAEIKNWNWTKYK